MARIGSTFTADQQFDPFTRMPAFPHRSLYRTCTPSAQYPKLRTPHGGIVRVEAMGAVGARAAERAEPERDMVGDGRWRRAFVQRVAGVKEQRAPSSRFH